jgi:hypothetical protein
MRAEVMVVVLSAGSNSGPLEVTVAVNATSLPSRRSGSVTLGWTLKKPVPSIDGRVQVSVPPEAAHVTVGSGSTSSPVNVPPSGSVSVRTTSLAGVPRFATWAESVPTLPGSKRPPAKSETDSEGCATPCAQSGNAASSKRGAATVRMFMTG